MVLIAQVYCSNTQDTTCLYACLPSLGIYIHIIYAEYFVLFTVFTAQRFCCDLTILCLLEIGMLGADGEPESKTVMSLLEKVVVMDTFDRGMRIAAVVLWCE